MIGSSRLLRPPIPVSIIPREGLKAPRRGNPVTLSIRHVIISCAISVENRQTLSVLVARVEGHVCVERVRPAGTVLRNLRTICTEVVVLAEAIVRALENQRNALVRNRHIDGLDEQIAPDANVRVVLADTRNRGALVGPPGVESYKGRRTRVDGQETACCRRRAVGAAWREGVQLDAWCGGRFGTCGQSDSMQPAILRRHCTRVGGRMERVEAPFSH